MEGGWHAPHTHFLQKMKIPTPLLVHRVTKFSRVTISEVLVFKDFPETTIPKKILNGSTLPPPTLNYAPRSLYQLALKTSCISAVKFPETKTKKTQYILGLESK